MGAREMIKVRDIDLTSTCEHHFVTIDGKVKVAYILGPRKSLVCRKLTALSVFSGNVPRCRNG
ncbi:MAG: GTP cyclohydrolase I [Thiolinea sp.]